MKKALIVAYAENYVIGHGGDLPWNLPADLQFFKRVTSGHAIIMGRRTFESIGRGLPDRTNIILTRNAAYQAPSECVVVNNLTEAFVRAVAVGHTMAFVIGGAQVYKEAVEVVDKLYVTEIQALLPGDTFFPSIDWTQWHSVKKEAHLRDNKHAFSYTFMEYERKGA